MIEDRHGHGNGAFWSDAPRHAHDDWWSGPLEFLVLLLLAGLVVALVVWLVRRLAPGAVAPAVAAPPSAAAPAADPAVATLRMRYARGEVSGDDFRRTLADLTGGSAEGRTWPGETAVEPTAETAAEEPPPSSP